MISVHPKEIHLIISKNQKCKLPEQGLEWEAACPVGAKTPTEASRVPGQTRDHIPPESPPVRREN